MHTWKPGDAPETHPMWEREVEFECTMMREGADKFREACAKASSKRQMTEVKPVEGLMVAWLPKMVTGIREWLRDCRTNGRRVMGSVPASSLRLRTIDPYLASYVTLRTVLNLITNSKTAVITIAKDIGLALEHEARMDAWEKRDRDLFRQKQQNFKGTREAPPADANHRRRVNIYNFNKLMREKLEWEDWSEHERMRLGLDLIDILIRYTKRFQMIPDPTHVARRGVKTSPAYVLVPEPALLEWLAARLDHMEILNPVYTPTLIPPRRWEGTRGGGYYTPHMRTPALIRFKAHQEGQRGYAEQEYDSIDMPAVYVALHALQETGWKINRRVLSVAHAMWDADMAIAGLPSKEVPKKAQAPKGASEEEIKAIKRAKNREWAAYAKRASVIRTTGATLQIADRYAEDVFYFPHMLDFRGRIYPIPLDLQPQGSDLARGLLTFSEGKPVDAEAAGWLAIHLANTFGRDKISFDERIAWVEANEAMWRAIDADPLADRQWCEHGVDHFQALAAVFEWVRWLDEGEGMISSLPIRVDGTCNGIQHLSALVRDPVGGSAVNLTPGEAPRDIYQEVATPLTMDLERIRAGGGPDAEKAAWWLQFVNDKGSLPRSLTKRPVMIMPYGGSREAYFKYTRDWLDEEHPEIVAEITALEKADVIPYGTIGRYVAFLVKLMWEVVAETASGGVKTMAWLQECAKHAAKGNQPIYWQVPSGFVVRHFYGKTKTRQIRTKCDGKGIRLIEHVRTKDLDPKEQLAGIAPNFIHSLDASALMTALVKAQGEGISALTSIHDAYGTVAADMWTLHRVLREAFIETHSADVLGSYRRACLDVLANHIVVTEGLAPEDAWMADQRADRMLPAPLPLGDLDLSQVVESDYFFG